MAQPLVSLFIDVENHQLVKSFTSTAPAILPVVYQGDTITMALRFMQATGVKNAPYTDLDYSGAAVTVAVGDIGAIPTAGHFTIADTGASQSTASLPYNATAAQVQTAIQTALTTNWSTATVLGPNSGPWTITNGSNGVQTALIGTPTTLAPSSSVVITTLQVGDSSLPAIEHVRLSVNPIALQNTWAASFSPDVLTGDLSLATAAIEESIGNSPCIAPSLQIKVIPVGGEAFTVYQRNFVIQNDLIDGAPSIPVLGVSYYTTVESDSRYNKGIFVERDATGHTAQHVITAGAGGSNILYLLSNAPDTVTFTFDNGTFDGQTITYYTSTALASISYSENVAGVLGDGDDSITAETSLSFIWNGSNSVWFPI